MNKTKWILLLSVLLLLGGGGMLAKRSVDKFLTAPPNLLTLSNFDQPFEFEWRGQEYNGIYEPHVAMFVPVRIPDVDHTFYMQFDMGAHSTVLSYREILSINEAFGDVFDVQRTEDTAVVVNPSFTVGTVNLQAEQLEFRNMGTAIDWSDPPEMIKIGTIGADFMDRHVLSIDFANEQILLSESETVQDLAEAEYLPFTFDGRKIFLSATFNDEPVSLWFDSGSSAFELIVEESTYEALATPGGKRHSYAGNSWGNTITINNAPASGRFTFGTTEVPLTFVTYIEWPNKLQAWILKMANLGGDLGGMTGNKLFLGKTLILDGAKRRYAVLAPRG